MRTKLNHAYLIGLPLPYNWIFFIKIQYYKNIKSVGPKWKLYRCFYLWRTELSKFEHYELQKDWRICTTAHEAWKKKCCNKDVDITQRNCSKWHVNSYVPIQRAIVKRTSSSNNLHATSPAQRDMFGKKLKCSDGLYKGYD